MSAKGKYIAVKPDTIIEARYDLTPKQNDILDMVLSKISDDNNYLFNLDLNEYRKLYRTDTSNIYRDLKKAVKDFEGKGFYLVDKDNKKEIFFAWFASIAYSDNEGKIVVEVGHQLKKLLIDMKKKIFYRIEYPLNFSSIYSKRIYYYLKSFEDTGWRIDDIEQLKRKLQCAENYSRYNDFKRKVILVAQEEINNYSDISFEFEEIKQQRKVVSLKFTIENVRRQIDASGDDSSTGSDIYDSIKSYIKEPLTKGEAEELFNLCQGNVLLLKEKYDIVQYSYKDTGKINSLFNLLKDVIKNPEKYKMPGTPDNISERKTKKNSKITNFTERVYNAKEIEDVWLKKSAKETFGD